jgi:hypothetical protein
MAGKHRKQSRWRIGSPWVVVSEPSEPHDENRGSEKGIDPEQDTQDVLRSAS